LYNEEDYLQLSGIRHFAYCPRRWALVHVELQWLENQHTVEGALLHERAHDASNCERRKGLLTIRGMRVSSRTIGITGVCDVVEFHQNETGVPLYGRRGKYQAIPIEYKRGKSKEHVSDRLQLCAQAMCLEEMLACKIESGYLFYCEPRRRVGVMLDDELRQNVVRMFAQMHEYVARGFTPTVKMRKECNACSLKDNCVPKLNRDTLVSDYINMTLSEESSICESY